MPSVGKFDSLTRSRNPKTRQASNKYIQDFVQLISGTFNQNKHTDRQKNFLK